MKVSKLIHEFGNNGQHRIVVQDDNGDLHPGRWAAYDAIAHNGSYYAATEYHCDVLPTGVFTCSSKPHQTISA